MADLASAPASDIGAEPEAAAVAAITSQVQRHLNVLASAETTNAKRRDALTALKSALFPTADGPSDAVLGALLFAGFDALQIRLQQTPLGAEIPYQIFLMIPYILSILALIFMSRRAEVPAALMVPYNRGER